MDQGEHCAIPPVFYDVSQSQDPSLHPPDPRPGPSGVVTPDESSHYYSFPSTPPGRQVVVHDYQQTQSVEITVPVPVSATVTSEPRPVPSLIQLSRFRPEDIPADAIVMPVAPLTDTKLIAALDTPLVSTMTALPAYSPELIPTQIFTFRGEDFDLVKGVVQPTLEKVDKLLVLCNILRKHPLQEPRFVLKVLGFMNAIADTILLGRSHM